jgi:lysophospholipase L1-like esterase
VSLEPLRVVIAGNSVASYLSPPRTVRSEGAYGELLPAVLAARGLPADVRVRSRWLGLIRDLRRDYERVIRDQCPDVVILNFGIVECQPNALPLWAVRHFSAWNRGGRMPARIYRRYVADRVWPVLRDYQRRASGLPIYRMGPRAFRYEMTRMVALIRQETRALVLVLDTDPVGARLEHWMPGMGPRRDRYQAILAEVVDRFGTDVRLINGSNTLCGREEEMLPDGLHRSPEGHRLLADLIADEIALWAGDPDGLSHDDPHRWL